MEMLIMSRKVKVLEALRHKKLTQQQAADQLNLSRRHINRIAKAYAADGIEGLIHKGKGRAGNRAKELHFKKRILELARTVYKGFGPTFMAEMLAEHNDIKISRESLRQLLISKGLWEAKRKKQVKQHAWRPPKDCFGDMIQADASKHIWFGDTYTTLITLIDDATSIVMMLFISEECTEGYKRILEQWVRTYGIPKAFYADRHQIFQSNTGKNRKLTQFQLVLKDLGIECIHAYSPQAKGRVERVHGTNQDRLVKEMRLRGINDLDAANQFLEQYYQPKHNKKFSKEPASSFDAHVSSENVDFNTVFSHREERILTNNRTIQFEGKTFLIERRQPIIVIPGEAVHVVKARNGKLSLSYNGVKLDFRYVPPRKRPVQEKMYVNRPPHKPSQAVKDRHYRFCLKK